MLVELRKASSDCQLFDLQRSMDVALGLRASDRHDAAKANGEKYLVH